MPKIPTIIPVSDLRQDAASLLSELRDSNEPMFITQRGRAAAVLIGIDAYQRSEEQRDILLLLARGEQEIASGVGHNLESVMAEADALLAEH
jgi:prevent-host-death family protein